MSKFVNDVRSSSSDARYMDGGFTGPMAHAIKQAKAAPEHGLPALPADAPRGVSRDRVALLQFLGLLPKPWTKFVLRHSRFPSITFSDPMGVGPQVFDSARDARTVADSLRIMGTGPYIVEAVRL